MDLKSALSLWAILFTTASANCNHNNCLRAVIASAFPSRNGTSDCASYFEVSVTPTTSWSTITSTPTSVPNYASACSGSIAYSSACSCVGAVHTTKSIYPPIQTSKAYFIVSPTSCPSSAPTGAIVGQSDASFSNANQGLQYQAYPNSQLVIQNSTSGPFFVDTSVPSMLKMSDSQGNSLIIYSDGTFSAFLGNCELEIVGSWLGANVGLPRAKRDDLFALLVTRQGSGVCSEILGYCNSKLGIFVNGAAGSALCFFLGTEIFEALGGGIGFLGNILGPEVGIPTTLGGIVLGAALGKFVSSTAIGSSLCGGVTSLLGATLCDLCQCSAGKISCNGGPCQDSLSDPKNCSSCGKVVSSLSAFILKKTRQFPPILSEILMHVHNVLLGSASMEYALSLYMMIMDWMMRHSNPNHHI